MKAHAKVSPCLQLCTSQQVCKRICHYLKLLLKIVLCQSPSEALHRG